MSLFTPNIESVDNFYTKEKFLLAWRISVFFTVTFLILFIIQSYLETNVRLIIGATFLAGLVSTIYLKITKNYKVIFWVYALIGTIMSNLAMNFVTSATHYVDFIWLFTCILIAIMGIGKKAGYFFISINFIGICYFYFFSLNHLIIELKPKSNLSLIAEFLELIFAFFVITYLLFKFSYFQNMSKSELKIATKDIAEKSNENEVLIKEIHHRVKNNLQIIISLLRLQSNELKSNEAKEQFSDAINRIMVMSLIHQKLYQDKSLAEIIIKDYLTDLTTDIKAVSTLIIPINIKIFSDIDRVGLKTIVPLGLIVNELLSNSLEHAFSNSKEANIDISIKEKSNNYFKLVYFDNGTWETKDIKYNSFGLELIETLTSQLEGDFKRNISKNGTSFEFNLKNIDIEN